MLMARVASALCAAHLGVVASVSGVPIARASISHTLPSITYPTTNVIEDGDSFIAGLGVGTTYVYPQQGWAFRSVGTTANVAVSGYSTGDLIANFAAHVVPQISSSPGVVNVCAELAATNDANIYTPAQSIANYGTLAGLACAAGCTYTIFATPVYKGGSYTQGNNNRDTLSPLMLALPASLSTPRCQVLVVDPYDDPQMNVLGAVTAQANATLYQSDNVHPTVTGDTLLAGPFANALYSIGSRARIDTLSVSTGPVAGGTTVMIGGVGLVGVSHCYLAGVPVASATQVDSGHWSLVTGAGYYAGAYPTYCLTTLGSAKGPTFTLY